jgi:hypothetical protein
MDEIDDVEYAMFEIKSNLRQAYKNGDTKRVTHELMEVLEEKMPRLEFQLMIDFLHAKHNQETSELARKYLSDQFKLRPDLS